MKLGEMQVTRSERVKVEARTFPTHASNRPFTPPKMAMSVNRSKRGPEKSRPESVGKTQHPDLRTQASRRELFYPPGSLRKGRTPQ